MTMHSWITISLGDPRPLYLQVIEQVKQRMAVGDLLPGTELPSIRELAAGLKISVITIKRAYLELERDGVIATWLAGIRCLVLSRTPRTGCISFTSR